MDTRPDGRAAISQLQAKPARPARPARPEGHDLSTLQQAVLLTVLYADLFDYPLTLDELQQYLVAPCTDRAELHAVVLSLCDRYVVYRNGFICWHGRQAIIEIRSERQQIVAERWPQAQRYARWLAQVPFVHMVAVCGSQAAGNAGPESDLDFFCISAPNRLWLVQSCAMVLRRIAALSGVHVCPNYFLTTARLEIEERNLYTAREISLVMPLWGIQTYRAFLNANSWMKNFTPNWPEVGSDRLILCSAAEPSGLRRWGEQLLGGRIGHALDGLIYRLLLCYYPLRLRRRGWRRREFARRYRRDRQTVMMGGYGPVVAQRFRDRVEKQLGTMEMKDELVRLFPAGCNEGAEAASPDPVFSQLMAEQYGNGQGMSDHND